MSKKYPNERDSIMVSPGSFTEERVIRGIQEHPSQRDADEVYLTGYAQLEGKRVPVVSGYWGDVEIWQVHTDAPDWPTCPKCGSQMDIGSAQIWHCWPCFYGALPTTGTGYKAHPRKEQVTCHTCGAVVDGDALAVQMAAEGGDA